jgi:glycine/D-amino acid oxidase-like deaminating enzyme
MDSSDAVVIGAGLTGSTAALELARHGVNVALIEQDSVAMNRASLRNEGKVHLGFVFVHDASLATSRLMIDGALSFRRILARLAGSPIDILGISHPFVYTVPADSLLAPDEIERRFRAIESYFARSLEEEADLDYLGRVPQRLFERVPLQSLAHLRTDGLQAAFATSEVAVDTGDLAAILRTAIDANPRLRFVPGRMVQRVRRTYNGFIVSGTADGEPWQIEAPQVINASWENRFAIDRSAGMEHAAGWLHRLKYRVIARVPDSMRDGPSLTMIVGRYGDVVIRPDGTAYFSWYPVGLQGWTAALAPPAEWNAPCRGEVEPEARRAIATALLNGIDRWYPGASQSTLELVDAGAIVAYGCTDVDDPASGLHDRTRVGVISSNGYHSVDPGKLTTAPLFGVRAAHAALAALTNAA